MEKQPERVQRQEITLEQANDIAKSIETLENQLKRINDAEHIQIFFMREPYGTRHRSENLEIDFAKEYIDKLTQELNQLKEQ